jgi:hypothetical protein
MAHGYLHGEGLPRSDQEAATHKMLIDMADIVRWVLLFRTCIDMLVIVRWVFNCRVSLSWQVKPPVSKRPLAWLEL